ncbi:unnamed protein product, partial [Trichogramma brassicae]
MSRKSRCLSTSSWLVDPDKDVKPSVVTPTTEVPNEPLSLRPDEPSRDTPARDVRARRTRGPSSRDEPTIDPSPHVVPARDSPPRDPPARGGPAYNHLSLSSLSITFFRSVQILLDQNYHPEDPVTCAIYFLSYLKLREKTSVSIPCAHKQHEFFCIRCNMSHKKRKQREIENPVEELQRLMKKVESINKRMVTVQEKLVPEQAGGRPPKDSMTDEPDKVEEADDEDEEEEMDDWSLVPTTFTLKVRVICVTPGVPGEREHVAWVLVTLGKSAAHLRKVQEVCSAQELTSEFPQRPGAPSYIARRGRRATAAAAAVVGSHCLSRGREVAPIPVRPRNGADPRSSALTRVRERERKRYVRRVSAAGSSRKQFYVAGAAVNSSANRRCIGTYTTKVALARTNARFSRKDTIFRVREFFEEITDYRQHLLWLEYSRVPRTRWFR